MRFVVPIRLLFLSFLLSPCVILAQQVTWGFGIGSTGSDNAQSGYQDAAGNVYTCGEFRGTVDFDPSPATALRTSNGAADAFLAKYDANGQFLFCITYGGSNLDKVNGVSTDPAGNIYMTGYFRGPNVDFDPSAATFLLNSNGEGGSDPGYGGDIVVAKYTATGQFVWAFNVGGSSLGESGVAIAANAAGDIFVGGYFRTDPDFDPSAATAILTQNTGTAFLVKYNTNGQYQWGFNFGQGGMIDNTVFDLQLDPAGNVIIGGFYQGTGIDFDPSPSTTAILNAGGNFDGYVAKYTTNGEYVFALSIGGLATDVTRGVAVDNVGNIYVVGDFQSSNVDFDPSASTALLTPTGSSDVYVAKYTPTGQYLWAFKAGSSGGEYGWKIATDNVNVFITGGFTSTADFNPGPAVDNLVSNGNMDMFLAKYDASGNYVCAFNVGSPDEDYGYDIMIAGADRFYITGSFRGTNIDFTPTQSTFLLSSAGSDDVFLTKYYWPDIVTPAGTLQGDDICIGEIGQLTFTATAGTSPFTITYTDGTNTFVQNNVQSGVPFNLQQAPIATTTYTLVNLQDALRCGQPAPASSSATVTVEVPQVTTTDDITICEGSSIQFNTTGAQTYAWTPSATLNNAAIANPIATPTAPTQYIVTGTTAAGCIAKDTVNVSLFPDAVITITDDTEICPNASLQLSVSGGQSYTWSPAATLDNPTSATPIATPATDTWYYVDIIDNNLCATRDSVHVTIRPNPVFSISNPASICVGESVQLTASGGDTYDWQPTTTLNNNTIANPIATPTSTTTYNVLITEAACNRSATLSTTIDVEVPQVRTINDIIICEGSSIQLTTTGAQTYSWTPAATLSNASIASPVATPAIPTQYIVTGVTATGCTGKDTVNVSFHPDPVITITDDTEICPNTSLQLSVAGGQSYTWSPAATLDNPTLATPIATPLTDTWYYVDIIDNNLCAARDSVHVTIRPDPIFTISNPASICAGEDIQLTASGGDIYDWQPATGLNNNTISNPVATPATTTNYSVLITESACNRSQTLSTIITVEVPQVRTINDITICKGSSIQLTTTGAQNYAWTPASSLSDPSVASPMATPTVSTQYIVTGITPGGCTGKDTVNVNLYPDPIITITNDTEICANTSLQLSVSGGLSYVWSPAATLDNPNSATPIATPVASTWYYVDITDNNLCPVQDSVHVGIRPIPVFTVSNAASICNGKSVQLNASGGDLYNWQPATGLTNNTIANPVANPAITTIYNVTITESVCNQSQTLTVPVTVNPLPTIVITKPNDIDCSYDRSQLSASGAVQYNWSPAATLTNPSIFNPVAMPTVTTDYTVRGIDANGCENTSTVTVKVDAVNQGNYVMASGFTPNNDGLNDCFGIKFWGLIQELEFSVYNRWGEKVFYTTNPRACWDGTFKGVKQDSGVFVYMIKAKTMCAPTIFRKGTFVLIR